ncbi:MAG: leucine-rich repeat protein [Clostridia bacterium]|nr:leucine-rich repeat protein [Clostridia bacterium]
MPLVNAKCTNCGANLEVDNAKDAAICEHCGSAFIVEKAINNYNVTNNIQAGVVNIFGGNSADFVICAGELVKYTGAATDVVIPETVTVINTDAFYGCIGLTSVVIPDSVQEIGYGLFKSCSSLKRVVIPKNLKNIGERAFESCSSLESINLPHGITSIPSYAFMGCSKLRTIEIPPTVITIEASAFSECGSLSRIELPYGVTSIESSAFRGCEALSDVVIPESVTKIDHSAFENCSSLKSIIIPNSAVDFYVPTDFLRRVLPFHEVERLQCPTVFKGCTKLRKIQFPEFIPEIAFYGSAWHREKELDKFWGDALARRMGSGAHSFNPGDFSIVWAQGKSVDDAIQNGLKKFGLSIQEYDFEVIQYEAKGLLGLGAVPAVVKLIKKEQ